MDRDKKKAQPPEKTNRTSKNLSKNETEENGKLTPARAEAIMSADLPSGDPELTAPAESGDQSPDYERERPKKAA